MPLIRKDEVVAPAQGGADDRWAAARDLVGREDAVAALAKALEAETDPRVREALFTGLAQTGGAEAAAVAIAYLRVDDAALRTAALDSLRSMPSAAQHAQDLLRDRDVDVRVLACELVRSLPAARAADLLAAALDQESDPNVCACAVEVLAEVGDTEALPALARCAERFPQEDFLRFAIRVAADRIGGAARG